MKKVVFIRIVMFVVLLFPISGLTAQRAVLDSLMGLYEKDNIDSLKFKHLDKLAWECKSLGLLDIALDYAEKQLLVAQRMNSKENVATSYVNLGVIKKNMGDYAKALTYYLKALDAGQQAKKEHFIAVCYGNIGILYGIQGKDKQTVEYLEKAIEIETKLKDTVELARHYSNLGAFYLEKEDFEKALEAQKKALNFLGNNEFPEFKSAVMLNIGECYSNMGVYNEAIIFFTKGMEVASTAGIKGRMALALADIGEVQLKQKNYVGGECNQLKALSIADSIRDYDLKKSILLNLSNLYSQKKQPQKALEFYKRAVEINDSLFSAEKMDEIARIESDYELSKQRQKIESAASAERQKWSFSSEVAFYGLVIVFLFLVGVLIFWVVSAKQKRLIESQTKAIEKQKKIVEEKNKDIMDSIHYAKRIQRALLREEEHVSTHLPEHFILFMPRDVVSGDFYWASEQGYYWYFAVADCTGHGVPGAIMSMLGVSFLNDILNTMHLPSPAEVLNKLRDMVVEELRQTDEAVGNKDGMDISLCCLNLKTLELQWAGANNPLTILSNGELKEIKADKQPIGYYTHSKPFTNHRLQMNQGDVIYLYSDGYADQFGGPKEKKLTYKRFETQLMVQATSMKQKKEQLKEYFNSWKGTLEQVDDVCVVGIRL